LSTAPNPIPLAAAPRRSPWRYVWRAAIVLALLVAAIVGVAAWYITTPQCEARVRQELISVLERSTGGRVELGAFRWRILHLAFEADQLTIHGLEAPGEAPYAHADRLYARVKILSFFRLKIGLNYLEADHPVIHIIVYPDGSTNQPRPKVPSTSKESVTDTIFDLAVDRTEVHDGMALVNQKAIPLDLAANNVGVTVTYSSPMLNSRQDRYTGSIHIEDLTAQREKAPPLHSKLDVKVDSGRNQVNLESMRLETDASVLNASGSLKNFADPQWQFKAQGKTDIREVQVLAQIDGLDRGQVELALQGQGTKSNFTVDGTSKVSGASYHVDSIHLANVNAESAIHLTPDELSLTRMQARLPQGGRVDGDLRIVHWLNSPPPSAVPPLPPASPRAASKASAVVADQNQQQGIIHARISGISVDSVMSMVAPAHYRDLGFDTIASGPANVNWRGSPNAFIVDAKLALTPSKVTPARQVPLTGTVDAQYSNVTGMVNIRNFAATTPGMQIQVSGALGVYPITRASQIQVSLTTTNLGEFDRTLRTLGLAEGGKTGVQAIPVRLHGEAQFHGTVTRSILMPDVKGHLNATNFDVVFSPPTIGEHAGKPSSPEPAAAQIVAQPSAPAVQPAATPAERTVHWDSIDADAEYAPDKISIQQATLVHGATNIHASGEVDAHQITARRSDFDEQSAIRADIHVQNAAVADLLLMAGEDIPVTGTLNLQMQAHGELTNLSGGGHLSLQGGDVYGEPYHSLNTDLRFVGKEIDANHLTFLQNGGHINGDGGYDLTTREFHFTAQGTGFDLAHFQRLKSTKYPMAGSLAFEAHGNGTIQSPNLEANLHLTHLNVGDKASGNIDVTAHTQGKALLADMDAHMANAQVQAHAETQLAGDYQTQARIVLSNLDLDPILRTLNVSGVTVHSSLAGTATVTGPLREPRKLSGDATIQQFGITVAGVPLKSDGPLHATIVQGRLHLDPLGILGDDTSIRAEGSVGLFVDPHDLDLHSSGSINMKLAQSFDSDLMASGHVDFNMDAEGTFQRPGLTGQVKFTNASIALQDFPNGLSQINGTLAFDQDRLDVKDLTAVSGGGKLRLGGFLTYQQGIYGDLTATAKDVRVRYPQGVSSMANANMRLQGTVNSLLLSGTVTITRFVLGSDLDLSTFSSASSGITLPPDQNAPSNHVRLDVHIVSAPELDFQNSYAKLAGEVDLRLRGTLAQPSVLGHILVTEGSATFAGTKYSLQHGAIYFTNPLRIDPVIDLSATARVEDYDITIGLNGTPSKLSPTFRSEPPLSEQDIFALLALGRTQEEQQVYTNMQQQAGVNSTADTLLGGALNATVSSRIQKLFGGGSVKIDPTYVSSVGNSSARITVEEQVSKNATLTYATNVNSTAQQLIQAQWNVTQNLSVVAVRDESGVFSLIFKIRRRYR
jgi:translocation and assembly module TamB